jgi:hypothetical protein
MRSLVRAGVWAIGSLLVAGALLGCSGKSTQSQPPDISAAGASSVGNGGGSLGGNTANSAGASGNSGAQTGGAVGSSGGAGGRPSIAPTGPTATTTDKVDLLFMIDNSVEMADKQAILRDAVPVLISRLTDPPCVSAEGVPTGMSSASGCPGGKSQFKPVADIHIGIVSSSLGAHGGVICSTAAATTDNLDDKAHLIGSMRPGLFDIAKTWNNSGFLAWDPTGLKDVPPGSSDAPALATTFEDMISATGEHGCGYEASLESWYRFLVDPEPPATVTLSGGSTTTRSSKTTAAGCTGCDDALLAQRKAFLRSDSALVIVMLSDENDCSIRDDGVGWFVGSTARMPLSTSACGQNPNDPCCRSCAQRETSPPAGCVSLSSDSVCSKVPIGQQYATYDTLHDSQNLRCFNQRQRFGFDLLYETSRYVQALSASTLPLQSSPATVVRNPLFTGDPGKPVRDPSLVFLAGIVGVPWQDVADNASESGPGLVYLTAKELVADGRWSGLLGDPTASPPVPPSDPFMIESIAPRTGMNTIAEPPVAITAYASTDPHANPINGHEQNIPLMDDLQYACTFPLGTPRECAKGDPECACSASAAGDSTDLMVRNSPVCQGGADINAQTGGKAYPGARELQVLKDIGDNAIVGSICPKEVVSASPSSDPAYGYNAVMFEIANRLSYVLQ